MPPSPSNSSDGKDYAQAWLLDDAEFVKQSEANLVTVTVDVRAARMTFEFARCGRIFAHGHLVPFDSTGSGSFATLLWHQEDAEYRRSDGCTSHHSSVQALLRRIQNEMAVSARAIIRLGVLAGEKIGPAEPGKWHHVGPPTDEDAWKWLEHRVIEYARIIEALERRSPPISDISQVALYLLACALLGVEPKPPPKCAPQKAPAEFELQVTLDQVEGLIALDWSTQTSPSLVRGRVHCAGENILVWELTVDGRTERETSAADSSSIRSRLNDWLKRYLVTRDAFFATWKRYAPGKSEIVFYEEHFDPEENRANWLSEIIGQMAEASALDDLVRLRVPDPSLLAELERETLREQQKAERRALEEQRRQEKMKRLAEERRLREAERDEARKAAEAKRAAEAAAAAAKVREAAVVQRAPLPPVPARVEMPALAFQETAFPLTSLQSFFLRERAALWWISNQSDDLLCLPHCHIQRLEYQVRTALRVLGPLRGRALLSDEVGLGKTIEAGLVIKELLTRGMARRFLVLTVPSLVDQWEEELNAKFGLTVNTTNRVARVNPEKFWESSEGLVASLHTLKQPAQAEMARQVQWDVLVVDEAHYLRNRDALAWQAVNALPRQFLLLLTATPVQNSIEELYNLVTLLQPGQLPAPKEFRARFIDPERPRQPREPEELRRLLGQVMIRNTRANAGIDLPPRRAETVLFAPDAAEQTFWENWEKEFRACLANLEKSQSRFWGRLVLQAAGSSTPAWRSALRKFPDESAARKWREETLVETSWRRKCELLPPLTKCEGGAVIFTQFLDTQAALAEYLRVAGIEVFAVNGSTPAAERQPLTEEFRKKGGALILTHSGVEGRNLQFCHRLVNFDLPWNPMEIEQRIGRLHRLGQKRPVHIYNFVQAGALQEHLLEILQEKLNLFELVVGETGLVLGERFSSDEFAEEIFRRWHENEGRVAEALATLGEELAAARDAYGEIKQLDETLFAKDYESV